MKIIYDNFNELAQKFTSGYSRSHTASSHTADDCIAWQTGAIEFAKWLDSNNYKIIQEVPNEQ